MKLRSSLARLLSRVCLTECVVLVNLGLHALILVRFYFSDSNLPVDKYFFSLTCCNAEGWVPIKTISTFKRMKDFESLGVPFVAYALRLSIKEDGNDPLVAVSEDGENVRRKRPLEKNTTAWDRSVYIVRETCLPWVPN